MYAFPYPESSCVVPLKVPVVAFTTISLSPQSLKSKGDDLVARCITGIAGDFGILGATGIAAYLQARLFFGLASAALGREVGHEQFGERSAAGGPKFIDIRIRRWFHVELYTRWATMQRELLPRDFKVLRQNLEKAFDEVKITLLIFDAIEAGNEVGIEDDVNLVLLSVHMLLFLIGDMLGFKLMSTYHGMASTKFLIQRMVSNGWCPKRLNIFNSVQTYYPCLYYLASITPPQAQHHTGCSPKMCMVSTVLLPPLHRTLECLCPSLQPSSAEVNRILTTGGVPLIRVSSSSNGGVKLEVVPYQRGSRFTAISHVWADRQFGSTQNSLPRCQVEHLYSLLQKIPRDDIWRWRNWSPWNHVPPGEIDTLVYPDELFWLDTFCIPQDPGHVALKDNAIQSMNFVYAVASRTLVLDADLQLFDAGRRPSSLFSGGNPTFFSPEDDKLLDAVSHIFASTWMGRAWTLQEGMISTSCVFQLNESQAHVKLLRSAYKDASFSLRDFLDVSFIKQLLFWKEVDDTSISYYQDYISHVVPFHERTQSLMWNLLKNSLDVQDVDEYARGSLARKSKFIVAHKLLQSRSTTQAADLPLILVNLSGLNGNFLSKVRDPAERMRLLMYGLGSIPLELLFFTCPRIGDSQTPDRWIPREVSQGVFGDKHVLRLEQSGFRIEYDPASTPPEIYILPKSYPRKNRYLVSCPSKSGLERRHYGIRTLFSNNGDVVADNVGWCILVDAGLQLRGAQFLITRMQQDAMYLRYDCPLEMTTVNMRDISEDDKRTLGDVYHAALLESGVEVLLERTDTPQLLGISRPQTPAQCADRLIALSGFIVLLLRYLERCLSFGYLEKWCNESTCFCICYGVFSWKQSAWVEEGLHAIVHRAWTATFQPDWDPAGSWKWFWKIMNFEPPVPFTTMMRWYCGCLLTIAITLDQFAIAAMVCFYWLPLYPLDQLIRLICSSFFTKAIARYLFK